MSNPVIKDELYWKYQGIVESFAEILKRNEMLLKNDEMLIASIAHICKKIYKMGLEDGLDVPSFEPKVVDMGGNICIKSMKVLN